MTTRRPAMDETRDRVVVRWIDRRPVSDRPDPDADAHAAAEHRLIHLVQRVAPPSPIGEAARARILRRLADGPAVARGPRGVRALRWAAIMILLSVSGAVVAGVGLQRWRRVPAAAPAAQAPAPSLRSSVRRQPARRPPPALVASEPAPPAASPPIAAPPPPPITAIPARRPSRTVAAASPAAPAARPLRPLAVEADLLSRAMVRLRQERDGAGALAQLDAYLARFPEGVLRREATIARAEALLLLGRDRQALVALNGVPLDSHGRGAELRVIRGELRATDDCGGAIADFDRVLAAATADPLVERALYGRATCRARRGENAAAARDLESYLARFPNGRFAAAARQARGAAGVPPPPPP